MKILLAVDGSPISTRAAGFAAKLASQFAQPPELILFHADPPLLQAVAVKLGLEAVKRYHEGNGDYATKAARARLKRARTAFVTKLVVGEPAPSIVKAARAERCDMIIMGSKGHSTLQNLFLGSVTAKVLAECDIPVVVAR